MVQHGDRGMIREDGELVKAAADLLALCDEVLDEPRNGRNREEDTATDDTAHVWPGGLIFECGGDKTAGSDHPADHVAYPVDGVEHRALNLRSLLSLHCLADRGRLAEILSSACDGKQQQRS